MQQQQSNFDILETQQTNVVHLQSVRQTRITTYEHFGALLRDVRKNTHVTQQEVADHFIGYCSPKRLTELGLQLPRMLKKNPKLDRKQIGKMEDGLRAPQFDELLPLYLALTAGCGVEIKPNNRRQFIFLARQKIESKRLHCEHLTPELWDLLTEQLR